MVNNGVVFVRKMDVQKNLNDVVFVQDIYHKKDDKNIVQPQHLVLIEFILNHQYFH